MPSLQPVLPDAPFIRPRGLSATANVDEIPHVAKTARYVFLSGPDEFY
jgi:hypothetical protein